MNTLASPEPNPFSKVALHYRPIKPKAVFKLRAPSYFASKLSLVWYNSRAKPQRRRTKAQMPEQSPIAFTLWQELRKYLTTKIEIGSPRMGIEMYNKGKQVVDVVINISNTAPLDDNFPLVVFTGVGLSVKDVEKYGYVIPSLSEFKIDSDSSETTRTQYYDKITQKHTVTTGIINLDYNFEEFPRDERYQGITLFPGEKTTLTLTIPVSDIPKYKFFIEGNISFRNFLRTNHPISIDVEEH